MISCLPSTHPYLRPFPSCDFHPTAHQFINDVSGVSCECMHQMGDQIICSIHQKYLPICSQLLLTLKLQTHTHTYLTLCDYRLIWTNQIKGGRKGRVNVVNRSPRHPPQHTHKMKEQQIGVQISDDFNLPMGQPPFNYSDPNKENRFHPWYDCNSGPSPHPSASFSSHLLEETSHTPFPSREISLFQHVFHSSI